MTTTRGTQLRAHGMRRGGTTAGLLITLTIISALGVSAIVIAPRYLNAGTALVDLHPQVRPARVDPHQRLLDDLALMIARCVGVLAIHQRGATPFVEVVLWLEDAPGGVTGKADRNELAVLSHSAVMRTVTIYRLAADEPAAAPGTLPPSGSPTFCDRWRADANVTPMILAQGVSDMRIEPVGHAQDEWGKEGRWGGLQRLLLALTWAPDSADGPDEAAALVDTVMFPNGARD